MPSSFKSNHHLIRKGFQLIQQFIETLTIILEGEVSRDSVAIVARKIIDSLSEPFELNKKKISISASIGISFFPKEGEDGSTLMKRADQAMYQAKALGKHTFQFWHPPH